MQDPELLRRLLHANYRIDAGSREAARAIVAKRAMPPLVLEVDDVHAAAARKQARGVELTQEPVARRRELSRSVGQRLKIVQAR